MAARLAVAMLIVCLSGMPAFAQDLRASAAVAARDMGLQDTQTPPRTRIPPKFLWTGVGLLGGGALTMVVGFAVDEDCRFLDSDDCAKFGTGYKVLGGAMMGAGAVLLAIGATKREQVPTVSYRRGGFIVQHAISF